MTLMTKQPQYGLVLHNCKWDQFKAEIEIDGLPFLTDHGSYPEEDITIQLRMPSMSEDKLVGDIVDPILYRIKKNVDSNGVSFSVYRNSCSYNSDRAIHIRNLRPVDIVVYTQHRRLSIMSAVPTRYTEMQFDETNKSWTETESGTNKWRESLKEIRDQLNDHPKLTDSDVATVTIEIDSDRVADVINLLRANGFNGKFKAIIP
jgi:hypothetical protein